MSTDLEAFMACMEYGACDRRPNHELGVWPQTRLRWAEESPESIDGFSWNWFVAEPAMGLDHREYVPINFSFIPHFEHEVREETEDYEIVRDHLGIVTRALKAGAVDGVRMSMDQHLEHPLKRSEDWPDLKRRLVAAIPDRYPPDLDDQLAAWQRRDYPLVLGTNCAANGFYWRAREFMGTEALSLAFYEYPDMMHEIMEYFADFIIETARPVLEKTDVEYFTLNEDFAMKSGPLLGPNIFQEFIFPHLKRMTETFRDWGVRYFAVDSDGDPTVLVPLMMDAGVNALWPIERASEVSPVEWRRQFGRELRLWGGVDKRVLPLGPCAIREHLRELIPLIEEGGYIPTIDHTVPPDVSWDNFRYYLDYKQALLTGDFAALD